MVSTAEHVAAVVRWNAAREGTRIEGTELALFRIVRDQAAEVWFFTEHDTAEEADAFSYTVPGARPTSLRPASTIALLPVSGRSRLRLQARPFQHATTSRLTPP
jgi:hypothetical protein